MRSSVHGLHKGTRVRVVGAGRKHGTGTISREPEPGAERVMYRSDHNLGERLAPLEKVRRIDGPRFAHG